MVSNYKHQIIHGISTSNSSILILHQILHYEFKPLHLFLYSQQYLYSTFLGQITASWINSFAKLF